MSGPVSSTKWPEEPCPMTVAMLGRARQPPPLVSRAAYHPFLVPVAGPLDPPSSLHRATATATAAPTAARYCYTGLGMHGLGLGLASPVTNTTAASSSTTAAITAVRPAVFCGLHKSLRDILSSKHTSSMYSLVPMMYSQGDLFYSPRSRRHGWDDGAGEEEARAGDDVSWKGPELINPAPNPKAHLHFNSAVRQAVEKYSDVLSSMKCQHMEDIIREVMRLCPMLRNEVTVKNRVKRAIKSYICNAVTHYKRKQRQKSLRCGESKAKNGEPDPAGSSDPVAVTEGREGRADPRGHGLEAPASPDVEDFFGRVDRDTVGLRVGRAWTVTPGAGRSPHAGPPEDGTGLAGLEGASHDDEGRANGLGRAFTRQSSRPDSPLVEVKVEEGASPHYASQGPLSPSQFGSEQAEGHLAASDGQSLAFRCKEEGDCLAAAASSGKAEEKGFHFSKGPSLEELRVLQADFAKQRDWDQFHQPRNLLIAMIAEVGELSELFQWRGECKVGLEDWSEHDKKHLGQELSDVLLYLIRLADKCRVDLPRAVVDKMGLNADKYPVDKAYGSSKKYNEYD